MKDTSSGSGRVFGSDLKEKPLHVKMGRGLVEQ
jgi:hypothetical protein